jgi:hypothetical protein
VFADGPVRGLCVLVHGATGGVGSIALQMSVRDGATVIAGVRDVICSYYAAADRPEIPHLNARLR